MGNPALVRAASITAAVTPVPQLAMMGFEASMFLDAKTSFSLAAGRRVFVEASRRSEMGTEIE
jgi:hypothetical protein